MRYIATTIQSNTELSPGYATAYSSAAGGIVKEEQVLGLVQPVGRSR